MDANGRNLAGLICKAGSTVPAGRMDYLTNTRRCEAALATTAGYSQLRLRRMPSIPNEKPADCFQSAGFA